MKKYFFFSFACTALCGMLLCGCGKQGGKTLTSATGSIYECLVVIPDKALSDEQLIAVGLAGLDHPESPYNDSMATCYDLVRSVMGADMPCMPQMEPYFSLSRVSPTAFDNLLRPSRNILWIDIDSARYTQTKAKVAVDYWSHPQAVYILQAPSHDAFVVWWLNHGERVRDWFVNQELERQAFFYRASTCKAARAAFRQHQHCDLLVSEDYMLIMDTVFTTEQATLTDNEVHVTWCCNNKGSLRRDLVLYSYPYTSPNTFTLPYLCNKRDEILSGVIHAGVEGTYMGTEYKVFPPQFQEIQVQGNHYAAQVRGLWKMYGGEAMGGPFVSISRLDEVHNRVVTAEVFVFAPGQKKRNPLRQAEAMLHTMAFPSDSIHSNE